MKKNFFDSVNTVYEIDNIKCPFCSSRTWTEQDKTIDYLDDEEETLVSCDMCGKTFSVTAYIEIVEKKNYIYEISPIPQPEDIIQDVPGQLFLWEGLNPGGLKIY